jgi:hypothetical protein
MHDTVTQDMDMFCGPLRLKDPQNPHKFLNVILLDMQGSGIEVNAMLGEVSRLNICVSLVSMVMLHFAATASSIPTCAAGRRTCTC